MGCNITLQPVLYLCRLCYKPGVDIVAYNSHGYYYNALYYYMQ